MPKDRVFSGREKVTFRRQRGRLGNFGRVATVGQECDHRPPVARLGQFTQALMAQGPILPFTSRSVLAAEVESPEQGASGLVSKSLRFDLASRGAKI